MILLLRSNHIQSSNLYTFARGQYECMTLSIDGQVKVYPSNQNHFSLYQWFDQELSLFLFDKIKLT